MPPERKGAYLNHLNDHSVGSFCENSLSENRVTNSHRGKDTGERDITCAEKSARHYYLGGSDNRRNHNDMRGQKLPQGKAKKKKKTVKKPRRLETLPQRAHHQTQRKQKRPKRRTKKRSQLSIRIISGCEQKRKKTVFTRQHSPRRDKSPHFPDPSQK